MNSPEKALHQDGWPGEELEHLHACPVCTSPKRSLLYDKLTDCVFFCAPGSWTLWQCADCAAAYLDPRPNAASIGQAYTSYYTHQSLRDDNNRKRGLLALIIALRNGYLNARYGYAFKPASLLGSFIISLLPIKRAGTDLDVRCLPKLPTGGRILDVGCGNGAFLQRMRSQGWDVVGLDIDLEAAETVRKMGIPVHVGPLEDNTFAHSSFDAITLNHVVEHLHDPIGTLHACARILKPGGLLWIATPNMASPLRSRYGRHWLAIDPPRHLVLFTPNSLRYACKKAGLKVLSVGGLPNEKVLIKRSLAIAEGLDPNKSRPLSIMTRWEIIKANIYSLLHKNRRGEMWILATRSTDNGESKPE